MRATLGPPGAVGGDDEVALVGREEAVALREASARADALLIQELRDKITVLEQSRARYVEQSRWLYAQSLELEQKTVEGRVRRINEECTDRLVDLEKKLQFWTNKCGDLERQRDQLAEEKAALEKERAELREAAEEAAREKAKAVEEMASAQRRADVVRTTLRESLPIMRHAYGLSRDVITNAGLGEGQNLILSAEPSVGLYAHGFDMLSRCLKTLPARVAIMAAKEGNQLATSICEYLLGSMRLHAPEASLELVARGFRDVSAEVAAEYRASVGDLAKRVAARFQREAPSLEALPSDDEEEEEEDVDVDDTSSGSLLPDEDTSKASKFQGKLAEAAPSSMAPEE